MPIIHRGDEGSLAGIVELAERIGNWPPFLALQRGLALALPLIMVGALALMARDFPLPGFGRLVDDLLGPVWRVACGRLVAGSFGIASLAALCGFAATLTEINNERRNERFVSSILAAVVTLSCFFVAAAPADPAAWKDVLSIDRGMLVALLVATLGCGLFLRLARIGRLRPPLGMTGNDPVVRDVLAVLPAGMLTILAFGLARAGFAVAGVEDPHLLARAVLAAPFREAGDGLGVALGYVTGSQALWFFGAHGPNLLYAVEDGLLNPAALANAEAVARGLPAPYIVTKPFIDAFARMGGSGATLCLILAVLIGGRDGGLRRLCLFALPPALFNVNEPLLFGIPLVLNPVYAIPFVLTPAAQTLVAYGATVLDLVPRTVSEPMWTAPPLLSGWTATGSSAGAALQVVNLGLGMGIYLPFVRLADRLRERRGRRVLEALTRVAEGAEAGGRGRRCLDHPGEAGRLAKALAGDLEAALAEVGGGLFLEYQPQVDASGNRVPGVEALLRWNHPTHGRVPPSVTVAVAEDADLIDRLGRFALDEACARRAAWRGLVPGDLVMSVNVSPRQLEDPRFDRVVLEALERAGLAGDLLELEITESLVVDRAGPVLETLARLRAAGARVAIDDFGMGHTSLRYLREFPVDTVKIDRSLTQESAGGVNDHIVRSIVDLARGLDIATVVEGVETPIQLARFVRLGCGVFQGYLFSRPLAADDCLEFIRGRAAAKAAC